MTRLQRRERELLRIQRRRRAAAAAVAANSTNLQTTDPTRPKKKQKLNKKSAPLVDFLEREALPYTPAEMHHHISPSKNFPANITAMLHDHQGDRAVQVNIHLNLIYGLSH